VELGGYIGQLPGLATSTYDDMFGGSLFDSITPYGRYQ